ncbi:hypothetical protein GC175_30495 [bacterium]|nr:hypothetical protein [bacterium]
MFQFRAAWMPIKYARRYSLGIVGALVLTLSALGILLASGTLQANVVQSTGSGRWSDPQVWSTGRVPQAGESVTVAKGHNVIYDVRSQAVLGEIMVEGTLYFDRDVDTQLYVNDHIMVSDGGFLNMGTAGDHIPVGVNAELRFVLTQAQADAYHGGQHFHSPDIGLWVMSGGRWDVHGAPLLRTWSKLAQDGVVGARTVVVENNVSDWYVGGLVVVTSTRNPIEFYIRESDQREMRRRHTEHEIHVIAALSPAEDGRTIIELESPLAFEHSGTSPFQGEVALLTRNVRVLTEITGKDEAAYDDVRERAFAHTMYMKGAQGNLAYVEFYRMGHYGKLGRYPIHHHMMEETSYGMVVRGTSGWENGFRCVNLHISHGVLIEDNVCYGSSSTAYFVEQDDEGVNRDHVFVHNIAIDTLTKHFEDRNNSAVHGEYRRVSSFWPGAGTVNEVHLGNVVAGGRGSGDASGFNFPESGNALDDGGRLPFTFVANEVHSLEDHGIFTWQNTGKERDMVGTKLWRNGSSGIDWGAYRAPFRYFNAELLENGEYGVSTLSVGTFLQDSTITGSTADGSSTDIGYYLHEYIAPEYPNPPTWLVRNRFADFKNYGITQFAKKPVDESGCSTKDFHPGAANLKQRPVFPGNCSAVYIVQMGNHFENVGEPLRFGDQANPNSWWKVIDHTVDGTPTADHVLVRKDQDAAGNRGVITEKLVTNAAEFSAAADALRIPMASLPASIEFTGLLNHRAQDQQNRSPAADFTFSTKADYPPEIEIEVTQNGSTATITADVSDDNGVQRVEFLLNWTVVATVTQAPYTVTIDLTQRGELAPQKYAYIYARAFDGVRPFDEGEDRNGSDYEQRAYSNVVEIGPETLLSLTPLAPTQPAVQIFLPQLSRELP